MSEIRIKTVAIDEEDDSIQFEICFDNNHCSAKLRFYGYSNEFVKFGKCLSDFPKSFRDTVSFEHGQKGSNWAHHLSIQAYCAQVNGHSALKISLTNNLGGPLFYHSEFHISAEPAAINRLGNGLKNWSPLVSQEFMWTPC